MSHTLGPWIVCDYEIEPHVVYIQQDVNQLPEGYGDVTSIGTVDLDGQNLSREEGLANARLIAAAPDLLEAGQLVIDRWCQGDLAEAVRMLDAAIKKAREGNDK
jgi:hypothetical protein